MPRWITRNAIFSADAHIWSREYDNFHNILPALWDFRLRGDPEEPWYHVGDTLDLLYEPSFFTIYSQYKDWLDYCWRMNDTFLIGNHDYQLKALGKVYPTRFVERLEVSGYFVFHGHTLDWTSNEEGDSIAGLHAALLYERFRWMPLAKRIKEYADSFHRDSEPFVGEIQAMGIDRAIFAHTHDPGIWGTIGNCGSVATTRTLLRLVGGELCLIKF